MTSNSSHDFLSIFFGGKYDLIQLQGIELYTNMLGTTFSPQNYHHQQFLSKLRENNENDMTSVVWAVIVFGPRVWPLSACRHYVLCEHRHALEILIKIWICLKFI